MTATFEEFQEKFQTQRLLIWKSDNWTWSVRPVHCTLGASVLSLNRWCPGLGEMTADEGAAFAKACHHVEARYAETFKSEKLNYLKLMMVDAHLQFPCDPPLWERSGISRPPLVRHRLADAARHRRWGRFRGTIRCWRKSATR